MPDITNLNGANFNELDSSILLTVGDGVSVSGNTYTVTPTGEGLANYDAWLGTLTNPDPSDTVEVSTFIPTSNPSPDVIEYTLTSANGDVSPATGGIGAEVLAWNSTGVLLEQLSSYVPGPAPVLNLDNEYFVLSTVDLSENDGSGGATPSELTFSDTGPFPTLCFLSGAGIATPSGETVVEHLVVGDMVLTASGVARPIAWIGTGRILTTSGRRNAATPVILRKHALAPNVPNRDLRVTKGHSFEFDGVLIPVEFLVNHRSILWDDHAAREVTLYHIELDTHDVLLANGARAESYRDDGNRWLFQNANSGWDQPAKPACLPVLTGGPVVDAVWRTLLDRAGPRPGLALTDDPDLHLLVDGRRLEAERRSETMYLFRLAMNGAASSIRIVSRAAIPAELGLARDSRALGVALRRVLGRNGEQSRIIDPSDDRLADGFHAYEHNCDLRWTDGDAVLPVGVFDGLGGSLELELHLGGTGHYVADVRREAAA